MIDATVTVNESIPKAEERQVLFEKTIDAMMKGIPAWLGYVQLATSLAITLGTNLGEADKILESALGVLETVEGDVAVLVKG